MTDWDLNASAEPDYVPDEWIDFLNTPVTESTEHPVDWDAP